MNRALLERTFEPAQIRQRKGRNGVLDYVEGHSVIARLNEALDGAWSFEVTHHEVREDEVVVLGKLSAEGIAKMQFGVSQLTREKGTGALVSLGDDLKAAATDALKKCATFLGVGLHRGTRQGHGRSQLSEAEELGEMAMKGSAFWSAAPAVLQGEVLPSIGAVPIMKSGRVIGAIGCGGGTGEQDHECAVAGAEAVAAH